MKKKRALFDNDCHISIKKLLSFDGALQFFAVWLEDELVDEAFKNTLRAIDFFKKETEKNSQSFKIITSCEDIQTDQISGLLTLEGGEALEGDLKNLHVFYDMGVRSITLTWNRPNALGCPAAESQSKGLTDLGKRAVAKMNTLGMIVDVSHLSEQGFWDVAERSSQPFIASHSNCRKLCTHKRNLTDDQLSAVAKMNGIVGVNLYPMFLCENGAASLTDVLRHIDHMLCVAGPSVVAFGGDFDGIDHTPDGMEDICCYHKLFSELARLYGSAIASDIAGGNILRLLKDTL